MAVLLLCLARPGAAFLDNTAGSAGQFLQIGAGARALGMGEAYGAVAEGPEAIYWNPAGLALASAPVFSYTRTEFARFMHHDFAAYAHPVAPIKGTLGVSLTYLSQESMTLLSNANADVGKFTPHSEVLSVGYATKFEAGEIKSMKDYFGESWNVPGLQRPLHDGHEPWTGTVMLGAAIKFLRESYGRRHASAVAVDGGVLFRPVGVRGLTLGLAFRHAGESMKFVYEGQPLPVEIDLGSAYEWRWRRSRLLASADVNLPFYGPPDGKLGVEYSMPLATNASIGFRLGFKTRTVGDIDPLSAFTAGVGVGVRSMTLDFGAQPAGVLGETYKVGLGYKF
ncbi:MAG: hypothetical protein HY927_13015 [Elusimicrobia bacterium]|nr:hypothetical protein [Elusimicrobiota bacterium]